MLIELSEFNFKLFLPLIFPAFRRIQDFTKILYIKDGYDDHTLFKTFRYYLCFIFSFIPLIIIYIRTKNAEKKLLIEKKEKEKEKKKENEKEKDRDKVKDKEKGKDDDEKIDSQKTLISNESLNDQNIKEDSEEVNNKKRRIKSYLFLGGLCLIAIICYYYRYFCEKFATREFKQSMGIFFNILGYVLLSMLILKQKLYLHSFVSMGIIGVLLIALFIITCFYIEEKSGIWKSFLYYLIYILLFILYDILKKKYMNLYFNTPYFMMVVIGIFGCVFVLIYDLILFLIDNNKEEVAKGFTHNIDGVGPAFALILDLLVQFIWNLGIWLTIYYLTPCHYFVSAYISEYIYYAESIKRNKDKSFYCTNNVIIFSIFAFVNFCCCLVFNEIIILNFCNLDYYTNKRIQERQRHESKQTSQAQALLNNDEKANIELSSNSSSINTN